MKEALSTGNVDGVRKLLSQGFAVDEIIPGADATALSVACQLGFEDIVHELLVAGADPNCYSITSPEKVPLRIASRRSCGKFLDILLESGADPNIFERNDSVLPPLHRAIYDEYLAGVQSLLFYGAVVNSENTARVPPLRLAVACKDVNVAKAVLNAGADVNARNTRGETALFACLHSPHDPSPMMRLLLCAGANINARLSDGSCVLHWLASHPKGNSALVHQLLMSGCKVNAINGLGQTPLETSLREFPHKQNIALQVSKCLVRHGADVGDAGVVDALLVKHPLHPLVFDMDVNTTMVQLCTEAGLKVNNIPWIDNFLSQNFCPSTSLLDQASQASEESEVKAEMNTKLQEYLRFLRNNPRPLKNLCDQGSVDSQLRWEEYSFDNPSTAFA